MEKVKEKIIITILVLLGVLLGGCQSHFQVGDTVDVSAGIDLGQLQIVESDAGLMYKWFEKNNEAWTDAERAEVAKKYFEMTRLLTKFKEKLIAGNTEYHRMLYFTEDFTDAWLDLRPDLQIIIDIVSPGMILEDELAISTWNKITGGMDLYLQANNIRLKQAKDGMDEATYSAFKDDMKGMVKLLTPLLKTGIPGL